MSIGLQNVKIIFDNRKKFISLTKDQVIKISSRNNIGCDQVIFIDKDESSIEFVPNRWGQDVRYAVDTTKLRNLGWSPSYPHGLFKWF